MTVLIGLSNKASFCVALNSQCKTETRTSVDPRSCLIPHHYSIGTHTGVYLFGTPICHIGACTAMIITRFIRNQAENSGGNKKVITLALLLHIGPCLSKKANFC